MKVYVIELVWNVDGVTTLMGACSTAEKAAEWITAKKAIDKAVMMEGWEPTYVYVVSPVDVDRDP